MKPPFPTSAKAKRPTALAATRARAGRLDSGSGVRSGGAGGATARRLRLFLERLADIFVLRVDMDGLR